MVEAANTDKVGEFKAQVKSLLKASKLQEAISYVENKYD